MILWTLDDTLAASLEVESLVALSGHEGSGLRLAIALAVNFLASGNGRSQAQLAGINCTSLGW